MITEGGLDTITERNKKQFPGFKLERREITMCPNSPCINKNVIRKAIKKIHGRVGHHIDILLFKELGL